MGMRRTGMMGLTLLQDKHILGKGGAQFSQRTMENARRSIYTRELLGDNNGHRRNPAEFEKFRMACMSGANPCAGVGGSTGGMRWRLMLKGAVETLSRDGWSVG